MDNEMSENQETTEIQTPVEDTALLEAASRTTGIIPSTSFQKYDPAAPPSAEIDCFGKYYLAGDIACDGDPSKPGGPYCIIREECKIRTATFQERIAKAMKSSADPRAGTPKTRTTRAKYTSEEVLQKVSRKDGLETVVLDPNEVGVKYRQNGGDVIFFAVTGSGAKVEFWIYATKEFPNSKKDGEYYAWSSKEEGQAFDALTATLALY